MQGFAPAVGAGGAISANHNGDTALPVLCMAYAVAVWHTLRKDTATDKYDEVLSQILDANWRVVHYRSGIAGGHNRSQNHKF